MHQVGTRTRALALAGLCACLASACGGSSTALPRPTGNVTVLMAVAPNSLDPALGYTPQAMEPDWLVYTPLLTYYHASGVPGTQLTAGLASLLPVVSDGGRTYTLTLRPGLVYSDGRPVKASDFTWAVERTIRLGWGGAPQLITHRIVGAAAYADRKAKTISGISADDSTGQITIRLNAPYGPFENVLALPATAPVPTGTPFQDENGHPPPGVGPYEFASVVPGSSFSLIRNPRWRRGSIPGVPAGHLNITARITGNAALNAASVLNNRADVFDWADRIPPGLLPRIERQAGVRYSKQVINATYLIFMNVTRKPFSSQLARIAVQTGLDDNALKDLSEGTLQEGCYLLPPSVFGHPHDQCPRGNIEKGGSVAAARALVSRSGMAGARLTVWGEANAPVSSWMAYYASLLDRIGFRAELKLVPDASYFATIGNRKLHPQTGFGDFAADVPNPADLYQWLTGSAIQSEGNQNWGEIDDPHVNGQVRILSAVPSSNLGAVSSFWHTLERYVADRAYLAVFGYRTVPQFVSDRLRYRSIVFSPVGGLDWSSFRFG